MLLLPLPTLFSCCLAVLGLVGWLGPGATVARAADVELTVITARLRERIARDAPPPAATIAAWLREQQPDGRWPDIDYADHGRVDWQPLQHLLRLRALALAYQQPGGAHLESSALLASYGRALAYYATNRAAIYSDNWWYNRIGQQLRLGEALLAMRPALSPEQVRAGSAVLEANVRCGAAECTGQNLVWTATAAIYKGCLESRRDYVALGFGAIQGTVVVAPASQEGIQVDWSFWQHGPQLYSGGYGGGFVEDVTAWAGVARGTGFAFPAATLAVLAHLVLDGHRWMVRGTTYDYSVLGRELTRQGISTKAQALAPAAEQLALLVPARAAEFRALAAAIRTPGTAPVCGNRHFWRSDYMAHQQAGFLASVRLFSTRTVGVEKINQENKLGYYLPHGATFVYRRGDEYRDIFPVWDWTRVPGVTCVPAAAPPPLAVEYQKGSSDFVGGVSDGSWGLAAFDYHEQGVTARKSWFFFEEGVFCLGAGISGPGALSTTVNQCRLTGEVLAASGATRQTLRRGTVALPATRWVHHDGVGYLFPDDSARVTVRSATQKGSWQRVAAQYAPDTVAQDVFSLWLSHGARARPATYQYAVLPGSTPAAMAAYAARPPVEVLRNTPAVQAMYHRGQQRAALAFYEAGQVLLPAGLTLAVDQPCLLLLRRRGRQLTLTVANPRGTALDITATLTPAGRPPRVVRFALPGGAAGGQSVQQELRL